MKDWLIGIALFTAPAAAQRPPDDPLAALGLRIAQPLTPEQAAATRAKVNDALAKAGVAPLFDNATDTYTGKARHRASGLVCPLGLKGQRVVAAAADGATCETRNGDAIATTTVVRAPADATLDTVAAAALASAQAEPGYAPAGGGSVTAHPRPGSDLPDHRTLRFTSRVGGPARASTVRVGLVRGWVLTERSTAPIRPADPTMESLLGQALFGEALFGTEMRAP